MFMLPVTKIRIESLSVMSESMMQQLECCSGSWKFCCKKVRKSREATPKKSRCRLPDPCAGGLLCICCKRSFSPDIIPLESEEAWIQQYNNTPTQQESRRMIITFSNSENFNLTLHPCPEAATLLFLVWTLSGCRFSHKFLPDHMNIMLLDINPEFSLKPIICMQSSSSLWLFFVSRLHFPQPMLSLLRLLKYCYDSDIKIGMRGCRLRIECGCLLKTLFWYPQS